MNKGLLHRLEALESRRPPCLLLLCVLDGRECRMSLIRAIKAHAKYIKTTEENSEFNELYRAILNTDLEALAEVAEK